MKIINNINFNGKQLKNAVIDKLGTAPSTPIVGQIYFNDGSVTAGDKGFYIYIDSAWVELTNQTMSASDILTALLTVDGAGSGLDADKLDGQEGTYYMAATTKLNAIPAPDGSVSLNSQKITSLATPTDGTDAVNKSYVDGLIQGLDIKGSVKAASTTDIPVTRTGFVLSVDTPFPTIDGINVAILDTRILLKNQTNQEQNCLVKVTGVSGSNVTELTVLSTEMQTVGGAVNNNIFVFVEQGTTLQDTGWVLSSDNNAPIFQGTNLVWTQFSSAGIITAGNGITKTGNVVAIDTSVVARKVVGAVPSGSTTASITHSLATSDISVSVREVSTGELVLADIVVTGTGGFNLVFDTAPTTDQYRYILIG